MSANKSFFLRIRAHLRHAYHGTGPGSVRFRFAVIGVDVLIIAFFIASPMTHENPAYLPIDYALASLLALDIGARALAWGSFRSWIRNPIVWVDLFVLATLLAPFWLANLGFLRVLRLWTLLHSEFFWRTVATRWDNTRWESAAKAVTNLVTLTFVITGFVYTSFAGVHPQMRTYVDALYFTVATLTTTGFGDIVLPGAWGKIISIVTMIAGISLFVRLAQTMLQPTKVHFPCPTCALQKHDPDAVHCKACGTLLCIPNDG
jgi:voltage-gated potassium channel